MEVSGKKSAEVVLLAEDVDRNGEKQLNEIVNHVVLLAEDVDRNEFVPPGLLGPDLVVLLAEDVDRNFVRRLNNAGLNSRPPRGGRG